MMPTNDTTPDAARLLHKAKWRLVDTDWHMIIGNRTVAVLMANADTLFPRYRWLSRIICDSIDDFGWDGVDFERLDIAQADLEQWWKHACRGEAYRP
jgi:hypothetical protein